jgi:hypothetical protein
VAEAVHAHANEISIIFVAEDGRRELQEWPSWRRSAMSPSSRGLSRDLDKLAKGQQHQGVVAIAGSYSYLSFEELLTQLPPRALLVALDEITDPHNFGAIVRSAVALGAHGVITLKHRAAPVTPVVVRASAGATEHAAHRAGGQPRADARGAARARLRVAGARRGGRRGPTRAGTEPGRARAGGGLGGPRPAPAGARALYPAGAYPDGRTDRVAERIGGSRHRTLCAADPRKRGRGHGQTSPLAARVR